MSFGPVPTPGVVVFSFANWVAAYPQFGGVSTQQAQEFFNRACLLVSNLPNSPIPYNLAVNPPDITRLIIMNAAVAHFAYLFTPDATGNARPVGRISQAAEGTVNLSLEYRLPDSDSEAFWNQTSYGAYLWVATLPYRSAVYMPGRTPQLCGGLGYFPARRRF